MNHYGRVCNNAGVSSPFSLRVPAGRTSSQHRLSVGVFICSTCTGAGILLSGSGVNVTGSSDVSCSPGGCRPPLHQRCRQLKSRLSLIPFSRAICATQAPGKRVCRTSLHLNSGENWFRRVLSAFTGGVTVGAEGYRPGKRARASCLQEYSPERGQSVNTW